MGTEARGVQAESGTDVDLLTNTGTSAMSPQPRSGHGTGRHRAGRRHSDAQAARDRLHEIDLLRISAALAVVLYHYTFSGHAGHLIKIAFPVLSTGTRYGYLGVDMFFTISGFVVLLSAWGRRPRDFVISRMTRLYPAFWVAVTITAIVAVTLGGGLIKVTPVQYLANLTMLNAVPHIANVDVVYWTLYAEIRFYLLVLVLAWIGITRGRVVTALWIWLAATAVIEAHVLPAGPAATIDVLVQSQWSHYFIAGMALCLIYCTGFSWQVAAVLVLAYANAIYQAISFGQLVSQRYHQPLHSPVIVAIITVIFVVMTLIALRVTRRLGRPWFAAAGALTYPLYLVHAYNGFVLINLASGVVNRWVLLVALVTGMGCVAYGIHWLAEVRFAPRLRRVLSRLASAADRSTPRTEAATAPRTAASSAPAAAPPAAGCEPRPGASSVMPPGIWPDDDGPTTAAARDDRPRLFSQSG